MNADSQAVVHAKLIADLEANDKQAWTYPLYIADIGPMADERGYARTGGGWNLQLMCEAFYVSYPDAHPADLSFDERQGFLRNLICKIPTVSSE